MTAERARGRVALFVTLSLLIGLGWVLLTQSTRDALVVYCAHDLLYAEEVLRDFEKQTGVPVIIVGDTEATKSLGLVQRLIREKNAPVCDVFWNNELLGTAELARRGVLKPYRGPGWQGIPEPFKEDNGLWTGFGGRLRVWIVNTQAQPQPEFKEDGHLLKADLSRLAIAQPMFGTTLTQYTVLHSQWGVDDLRAWHQTQKDDGVRFVPGNATVKDLVAKGVCDLGLTDTDDAFQALDAGAHIEMRPYRLENGQTICIPNTVAIINGTDRRTAAEQLVDFLLSPATELRLAQSRSRQIPLGAVPALDLPDEVRPLLDWSKNSVSLKSNRLVDSRDECLDWLTQEFAP